MKGIIVDSSHYLYRTIKASKFIIYAITYGNLGCSFIIQVPYDA